MKQIRKLLCLVLVTLSVPSIASAATDYTFETDDTPEYYPSTSYEEIYGSLYNYGGPNIVDYQIPELEYGTFSTTQTGIMEKALLPGLQASVSTASGGGYGISGGAYGISESIAALPELPEVLPDFQDLQYQLPAYTSVEGMEREDGSIGTIQIPSLDISMKLWEGETNASMAKGLGHYALDRGLSPEQRQEWNSIYASFRGRSVLTGAIAGVDRHSVRVRDRRTGAMVRQDMYCATVIPFRVRILIPSTEMWMQGEERPDYVLRNMSGAVIDFVVTHVDREAGFAIASRRLALRTRRYYFSTQPSMNRSGARVKCHVLAVGPRRCLVECGGYDIDLTQREMRYTAIPDLREQYHRGDTLDCIVKSYDREGGKLVISVKETIPNPFDGAELRHPAHPIRCAGWLWYDDYLSIRAIIHRSTQETEYAY